MNKKLLITCLLAYTSLLRPVKAEEIRGFDAKSDIKIGPVLTVGIPVVSTANVSYAPNITLNFFGESYLSGTTGISIGWINNTKSLTTTVAGKTLFTDSSPSSGATTITKSLFLVTLMSPINYRPESVFEYGWQGGFFSQFVSFDKAVSGDTNSNIGLSAGGYAKTSYFYPFVPYINGKIILGNLYDNGKTIQDNKLASSLKSGYFGSVGLDFYLNKQIFFNVGYNIMNPDLLTIFPTKANVVQPGQVNTQPADDQFINLSETVQTVSGSFGFLF